MSINRIKDYLDPESNNLIVFQKYIPKVFYMQSSEEEEGYEPYADSDEEEEEVKPVEEMAKMTDINMWIVHIKHNLTERMVNSIKKIDGVEMICPYSRYRFALGIGKLFDENKVKKELQESILEFIQKKDQ